MFGNTYKEARAHEQEPPPSGIIELQLKTTSENVNKFRYCNVLFGYYVRKILVKTS